jgi:hypothetical protein
MGIVRAERLPPLKLDTSINRVAEREAILPRDLPRREESAIAS